MSMPQLKPTILLSPIQDGYVAYDTETDQLHRLNAVASLIVELCDGKRSITEIETVVAPLVPDLDTDPIRAWIEEALDKQILVNDADPSVSTAELSSDQLVELADQLREHGKIRTAYVCQKQAVELDPNNAAKWSNAGELAHIAGLREDARAAYEQYLILEPDDAEISHLLVALRDEAPPTRVPDECIEQLYKRFSSFYDENLVDELEFAVPERLSDAIETYFPERTDLSILDVGCGTGLSGERLRTRAQILEGIDLSAEMIEMARKRNIYDTLQVGELTNWLSNAAKTGEKHFDLIVACDTLIYIGDLHQVIGPASQLLSDGGAIAFSVERSEQSPYVLTDSGRYAHHLDHLEDVAQDSGLSIVYHGVHFLRMEYGEEVIGHIVVMA